VLFNAGYNEQVFSPKSWKIKRLAQNRLIVFEKNKKNAHINSENDVTEPKVRLL